jgi:hypothetical protein
MLKIARPVLALALCLTATTTEAKRLPLPEPNPERGAIAVTMRCRAPAGTKSPAVQVHFVRLGDDVDIYAADSVISSNFSDDKQVYLLNARPGSYVAVAAELRSSAPGEYDIFLSKETIASTEVEVIPGRITFMGDFLIDLKTKMSKSDEAQAHYFRLLEPGSARKGWIARAYTYKNVYRGDLVSVDRDEQTRYDFWAHARDKVFEQEPGWVAEVEQELAEPTGEANVAEAPDPPPTPTDPPR